MTTKFVEIGYIIFIYTLFRFGEIGAGVVIAIGSTPGVVGSSEARRFFFRSILI
jgi:hypothetical protein